MTFEILKDAGGRYRWRMTDARGKVVPFRAGGLPGVAVSREKEATFDRAVQAALRQAYDEQTAKSAHG